MSKFTCTMTLFLYSFFFFFAMFALKAGACQSAVGGLRQSNHVYSTVLGFITSPKGEKWANSCSRGFI